MNLLRCECGVFFATEMDMWLHSQVCKRRLNGWRKSDFSDRVEIKPSDQDLLLVQAVVQNGFKWIPLGNYEYNISMSRDWLKRRIRKDI